MTKLLIVFSLGALALPCVAVGQTPAEKGKDASPFNTPLAPVTAITELKGESGEICTLRVDERIVRITAPSTIPAKGYCDVRCDLTGGDASITLSCTTQGMVEKDGLFYCDRDLQGLKVETVRAVSSKCYDK